MLHSFVNLFRWNLQCHTYTPAAQMCRAWRAWDRTHSAAFLRVHGPHSSGFALRGSRYSSDYSDWGLSNQTQNAEKRIRWLIIAPWNKKHWECYLFTHHKSKCNLGHTRAVLDRLPSSDRHFPDSAISQLAWRVVKDEESEVIAGYSC